MPSRLLVASKPPEPQAQTLRRAHAILCYAHDSTSSLLTVFDERRTARRATGGATSDEEQDLLRSMLVFACAGLDSIAKYVVHENLALIACKDERCRDALEKTLARRLVRADSALDDGADLLDTKFLARVLMGRTPVPGVLDALADELTAGSLQSAEELLKVATHLGLEPGQLLRDIPKLKEIFRARNRIIHEMDVDFEHRTRNRRTHKRDDVVRMVNDILAVGNLLLTRVDTLLST